MISVVCVYNDEAVANRYIFKSLHDQTVPYELIALDNREGRFNSAAQALNAGADEAHGKYIMFVHQDVDLCANTALEDIERLLETLPYLGIAGVAGREKNGRRTLTNIKHGVPPEDVRKSIPIENPVKVQTLDECMAIVPKAVFEKLKFDEKTCADWHAYVVDYCLTAKERGLEAYVLPTPIYHSSMGFEPKSIMQFIENPGRYPKEYYLTMEKLLAKHGKDHRAISTTCGIWSAVCPLSLQKAYKFFRGAAYYVKNSCRMYVKKLHT